eukprot:s2370_g3.t1
MPVQDGASIRVRIEPPVEEAHPDHALHDALWEADESSEGSLDDLPPRSRSPRRQLDPADEHSLLAHQGAPVPHRPLLDDPQIAVPSDDDAPQEHHDQAEVSDESSPTATTYDSDDPSHFFHIFCIQAAMTSARIATHNWAVMQSNIRYVLHFERHQIQQLHIVPLRHLPGDLRSSNTQVALVQQQGELPPGSILKMLLVDIVFHGHQQTDTNTHRSAKYLPMQITRSTLLQTLGVEPYCNLPGVRRRCLVRLNHRRIPLQSLALVTLEHADYIRIDLPPCRDAQLHTRFVARCLRDGLTFSQARQQYQSQPNDDDWETVSNDPMECEDFSTLQFSLHTARLTVGTVAHAPRPVSNEEIQRQTISLENCIAPPAQVQVDFSQASWVRHELNACPLPVQQQWPDNLALPPATIAAIQELLDMPDELPHAFHFYTDGSKIRGHQVGAAVVLLCEYSSGLAYGGHICCRVDDAQHAHLGEHSAMIWALLWSLRCSSWIQQVEYSERPHFHFHFDATTTGFQAAGLWKTARFVPWKTFMRALVHLLHERHGPGFLHWHHVKAYSGHPWNELADQLAKLASRAGNLVPNCEPWVSWISDPQMLRALEWCWFLEHLEWQPQDGPTLRHHTLIHNISAPLGSEVFPSSSPSGDIEYQDLQLTMNIATIKGVE